MKVGADILLAVVIVLGAYTRLTDAGLGCLIGRDVTDTWVYL